MDRCHRIGQDRPVLVFRLATSHSVEGKMLRRACDKMALERLVIKKGVFKEVLDVGVDADKVRGHGWRLMQAGVAGMLVAWLCCT
jgi:SNF2 family DNA or RNA helicase